MTSKSILSASPPMHAQSAACASITNVRVIADQQQMPARVLACEIHQCLAWPYQHSCCVQHTTFAGSISHARAVTYSTVCCAWRVCSRSVLLCMLMLDESQHRSHGRRIAHYRCTCKQLMDTRCCPTANNCKASYPSGCARCTASHQPAYLQKASLMAVTRPHCNILQACCTVDQEDLEQPLMLMLAT